MDLVLYDGVCGFCNSTVRFIIDRDPERRFRFLALQSDGARARLAPFPDVPRNLDTLVVLAEGRAFIRSDAVIYILRRLKSPWPAVAATLACVPRPLRDLGYRGFAKARYRLFGKFESCPLPRAEERALFLD